MSETKSATTGSSLFAALAKVQAELKPIERNAEGQAGTRKHKYADLAAVSRIVLPLLGKHGLSFSARPTMTGSGQFVLTYSLLHESGEREDGQYPLSTGTPQQLGSAVTYARRYALCAITGAVPEGEDDDGAAAEQAHPAQTEDWRNAPPVQRAQRQQPSAEPAQWETSPQGEPVTDMDWFSDITSERIASATDADTLNKYWHEAAAVHESGKCTDEHFGQIKAQIRSRGQDLGLPAKAKAQADQASNGKTPEPTAS
jgi:hypothetical protein